jgi:hypothetical protein
MAPPIVSVIMRAHNAGRYISSAIDSIVQQTFGDWELVVVDDGSTDLTPNILNAYAKDGLQSRLRVVRQERRGAVAALNVAARHSRGRYLAWMDADDIALPRRLEQQVAYLEKFKHVAVLGGALSVIDHEHRILLSVGYPTGDENIRHKLLSSNQIAASAAMIRKAVFDNVGGGRGAFAPSEDYDLWLRIADRFAFGNLAEPVLLYRVHPAQESTLREEQQVIASVAAQVSAIVRRHTGVDPFFAHSQLDLGSLISIDTTHGLVTRDEIYTRLADTASGRAAFLTLIGHTQAASRVMSWVDRTCAAATRLPAPTRAKMRMARALLCKREGHMWPSAQNLALSLIDHPGYVLQSALYNARSVVAAAISANP